MRERDLKQNPLDDPLYPVKQIERSVGQRLGNGPFFHYTLLRLRGGVAFGGLHETVTGARQAQDQFEAEKAHKSEERIETPPVGELRVGQKYHMFGGSDHRHGIDDGTHGHVIDIPSPLEVGEPEER